MKKSSFAALLLTTVSGVLFAVGSPFDYMGLLLALLPLSLAGVAYRSVFQTAVVRRHERAISPSRYIAAVLRAVRQRKNAASRQKLYPRIGGLGKHRAAFCT